MSKSLKNIPEIEEHKLKPVLVPADLAEGREAEADAGVIMINDKV